MAEKKINDSDANFDWLEKAISENYIKYYNYTKFIDKKEISNSPYGNTFCAKWKDSDTNMVLKHSHSLTIKEIVNEVNYYKYYAVQYLHEKILLINLKCI